MKPVKESKANKVDRLREIKETLEKTAEVKYWLKFNKMPNAARAKLYKDWDDYFVAVRDTRAYKRHRKISKLISQGQLAKAKLWIAKANEQREKQDWELTKPPGFDPRWLKQSARVTQYERVMNKLAELYGGRTEAGKMAAELM